MAEVYVNFWDNGLLKWSLKENKFSNNEQSNLFFENLKKVTERLVGCDIKSNLSQNKLYVRREGFIFYEILLNKIVSVTLLNEQLYIETEDDVTTNLIFISEAEARKAQQRVLFILNGFEIIGCQDERVFDCRPSNQMSVVFN